MGKQEPNIMTLWKHNLLLQLGFLWKKSWLVCIIQQNFRRQSFIEEETEKNKNKNWTVYWFKSIKDVEKL